MGENGQLWPSNVTRPIRAPKAKSMHKMSEAMINENEKQRDVRLEHLREQQLQRMKNKIEEKYYVRRTTQSKSLTPTNCGAKPTTN